jgi:hypothetical protein
MKKLPVKKYFSFIAGAVDTDVPSLSNISENFREISKKSPNGILRGLGGNDS